MKIVTIISFFPLLFINLLYCPQLLLELHPPVLEPDLDLPLRQTQRMGNLNTASSGEIMVEMELLLQLQGLVASVCLPAPLPL